MSSDTTSDTASSDTAVSARTQSLIGQSIVGNVQAPVRRVPNSEHVCAVARELTSRVIVGAGGTLAEFVQSQPVSFSFVSEAIESSFFQIKEPSKRLLITLNSHAAIGLETVLDELIRQFTAAHQLTKTNGAFDPFDSSLVDNLKSVGDFVVDKAGLPEPARRNVVAYLSQSIQDARVDYYLRLEGRLHEVIESTLLPACTSLTPFLHELENGSRLTVTVTVSARGHRSEVITSSSGDKRNLSLELSYRELNSSARAIATTVYSLVQADRSSRGETADHAHILEASHSVINQLILYHSYNGASPSLIADLNESRTLLS